MGYIYLITNKIDGKKYVGQTLEKDIFERWKEISPQKYGSMAGVTKKSNDSVLMIPSGSERNFEGNPFETPTSMRSVDKECRAKIISSWNSEK